MKTLVKNLFFISLFVINLTGCASREYVHEYVQSQMAPLNVRTNSLDSRLGSAESDIKAQASKQQQTDAVVAEVQVTLRVHADRMTKNEADITQLSKTAQEAVERASVAGKLAEGKLTYEVVLSDDKLKFAPNRAALSGVGEAELDAFVAKLKDENKGVHIEIQGHTDSTGDASSNLKLGEARAEAVMRYLNIKGGIPLHHMAAISYGESEPIADNRYKAGRQLNRRVVLVVIQ
jgi:outer membrane protein OmpA-like peptidoglycan-associated protein